jgi:glycosyltransferase involved in cell wall biosynthesis
MKIHILFDMEGDMSGGGSQFLKLLRNYFINNNLYEEDTSKADVILFNSHHNIDKLIKLKARYANKLFIHRVDGPIRLYNQITDKRDFVVYCSNKFISDGTIFQSNWSKDSNLKMGMTQNANETTIINAPDSALFNKLNKNKYRESDKVRIAIASWSNNVKKGFPVYKWMDENLNFTKYSVTFIGNTPIRFKNIDCKLIEDRKKLSDELKKHDIFVTASQNDPCSNSLIEALHCNLPVLALNNGGHGEIVSNGGELFNDNNEIIEMLGKITNNYYHYQSQIKMPNIDEIGNRYFDFIDNIYQRQNNNKYQSNNFGLYEKMMLKFSLLVWKTSLIKQAVMNNIGNA